MDESDEQTVYTASSLADEAGVNVTYVARLCRLGKIRAEKVGPIWLIQREEARAWLERRRQRQVDESAQ